MPSNRVFNTPRDVQHTTKTDVPGNGCVANWSKQQLAPNEGYAASGGVQRNHEDQACKPGSRLISL